MTAMQRPHRAVKLSLHMLKQLINRYQTEIGDPDSGCFGSAKADLQRYLRAAGAELEFDINKRGEWAPGRGEAA